MLILMEQTTMKLLSYLSFLFILLSLFACTKTVVPNEILMYQNIVMTSDESVAIVAYDISKKPFETHLLITDWNNNVKYQKNLGDSLIFVGSFESDINFNIVLSSKNDYKTYIMQFDGFGVIKNISTLSLKAVTVKTSNNKILLCGQSAYNEPSLIVLDRKKNIVENSVIIGSSIRDCASLNDSYFALVYDSEASKATVYNKRELLYSFECNENEVTKLTPYHNNLRLHYLTDSGMLKIIDISPLGNVISSVELELSLATNFTVVNNNSVNYYSVIHKSDSGPSYTKVYKLDKENLIDITFNLGNPTLARLYTKNNHVISCTFKLTESEPLNGFSLIR